MFALKNKVQLIGNLGNTPEIKTLETGKKMARFSVATSEVYRNAKGEKVTETVTVSPAEFAPSLQLTTYWVVADGLTVGFLSVDVNPGGMEVHT